MKNERVDSHVLFQHSTVKCYLSYVCTDVTPPLLKTDSGIVNFN